MLERLFQALFTYRPIVFQQGEFRFDITTASLVAVALNAAGMNALVAVIAPVAAVVVVPRL